MLRGAAKGNEFSSLAILLRHPPAVSTYSEGEMQKKQYLVHTTTDD